MAKKNRIGLTKEGLEMGLWSSPPLRMVITMNKILVPIDFSDVTEAVVAAATEFAKVYQAEILLLHIATDDSSTVESFTVGPGMGATGGGGAFTYMGPTFLPLEKEASTGDEEEMPQLRRWARKVMQEDLKVQAIHGVGQPHRAILEHIEHDRVDLVVMGSHGHGSLHNLLVGSVAEQVLRKSPVPVLLVPAPGKD